MTRKRRGPNLSTVSMTMNPDERVRFRLAVSHADVPAGVLVSRWAKRYLARHGISVQPLDSDAPDDEE